jgi:hypothetical protein
MTLALHTSGPSRDYTQEVVDLGHARELVETLAPDDHWQLVETAGSLDEPGRELASGTGPNWHEPPRISPG